MPFVILTDLNFFYLLWFIHFNVVLCIHLNLALLLHQALLLSSACTKHYFRSCLSPFTFICVHLYVIALLYVLEEWALWLFSVGFLSPSDYNSTELGIWKGLLKKPTTWNQALTPASLTVHRYIIPSEAANSVMHNRFPVFFHLENGIIKLVWESWVQNLSCKVY